MTKCTMRSSIMFMFRCVICMIEFQVGDQVRYLPCMHMYHIECIDDWLMRSFTCPSCMEPVDAALLGQYGIWCDWLLDMELKPKHGLYNGYGTRNYVWEIIFIEQLALYNYFIDVLKVIIVLLQLPTTPTSERSCSVQCSAMWMWSSK